MRWTNHGGAWRPPCAGLLAAAMRLALAVVCGQLAAGGAARAEDAEPAPAPESFAVHGQFTYVEQETLGFNAPYRGANSLSSNQGRETTDATLFLGRALWAGAEIWINPELDQGFGLDNTVGVAGFPSAEAYKVGKNQPYLRLPRLFVRDTLDLDGEHEAVEPDANWLAGERSVNRWVLTVGKFGVTDIFDANQYAHDPKGDFLNWSVVDAGSYDYAADAWAYTVGAAVERYQGHWTVRGGIFDLSDVPNSVHLDPGFHEFQWDGEVEHRHSIAGRTGKLMVTAFLSRGRMALLDAAIERAELVGGPPLVAPVRQYRSRPGVHLSLEQQLAGDLGLFARIGKAAGNVEAYEFTDIDRSVAAGLSLKGPRWGRSEDKVGLALVDNGISAEREQYLNDGGLGILVGDGKLPHPRNEEILETFYDAALLPHTGFTLDYQFIENPGYNHDRGPVSVWAVRFHAQF